MLLITITNKSDNLEEIDTSHEKQEETENLNSFQGH